MPDFLIHVPGHPPYRMTQDLRELRIGRTPDQDIILDDPAISRNHARLFWKGGELYLEDLGSKHGCFVQGKRISSPCAVGGERVVAIGPLEMLLELLEPKNLDPDLIASES
jgi:pSer/pThr/pTyr-binding forkhead associated (FHA) protein